MRKVIFATIMIVFFIGKAVCADKISIQFNPGFATYDMAGLRSINQLVIKKDQYDIPMEVTEDFPGGFYYQAGISYHPGEEVEYGLAYEYHSTYSELIGHSASSEYSWKNDITANSIIGNLDIIVDNKKLLDFRIYSAIAVNLTDLKNTERIKVSEVDTLVSRDLSAVGYGLEAGVKLLYHSGFWSTGLKVGYQKEFGGQLKIGEADFYNPETLDPVKSNWDGFRVSLMLIIDPVRLFNGSNGK